MVYFTSDLHFGHANLLEHRPAFSSVEEMDKALIDNWNSRVQDNDTVYIVGDVMFRNARPAHSYLTALRGHKILIRGNHDHAWMKPDPSDYAAYFDGVYEMHTIKGGGTVIALCHYPMVCWDNSRHGSLLVCGHIHDCAEGYEYEMFQKLPLAFNAGADLCGFIPRTLSELVGINDRFYCRTRSAEEQDFLAQKCRAFEEATAYAECSKGHSATK